MPSSSVLHKRASQRTPFFGFERDCNLASVVKEIYARILSDTNISQKPCKVVAVDLGNVFQGRKPEQKFTGPRKHNVKKLWPKMVGWACRSSLTMQFTQSKAVHSRGFLALSHDLITFNWIAIGCLVFQFHSKQHKLQIKHGKWWSQNAIGLKVSATLVAISFGQEICKRFPFNGIQEVLKRIEEEKNVPAHSTKNLKENDQKNVHVLTRNRPTAGWPGNLASGGPATPTLDGGPCTACRGGTGTAAGPGGRAASAAAGPGP